MSTIPFHNLDDEACPEENEDPETEVKQCPLRKHWCRLIPPRAFLAPFMVAGIVCMVVFLILHSPSKGHSRPHSAPTSSTPSSFTGHSRPHSAPTSSTPSSFTGHSRPHSAPTSSTPSSFTGHSRPHSAPTSSTPSSFTGRSRPHSAPTSSTPSSVTEMEKDMKTSEYPCNDFYEYSCGKYIDRFLPDRSTYSIVFKDRFTSLEESNKNRARKVMEGMSNTKDPYFKKAYTFYTACMNSPRDMDAYFKAADEIGGSDITTIGPFDYANWDLEATIKKMKIQYNANPLINIQISHDLFNAARNILMINPPDFHLLAKVANDDNKLPRFKERSHFDDVFEYDLNAVSSLVETFNERLRDTFVLSASYRTGRSYLRTSSEVLEAATLESSILKDVIATFTGSTIHSIYQVVTVGKLNSITGYTIRWSSLLQSLHPEGSSFNINNDTEIGLKVPLSYLKKVQSYASYTQRRKLPNYFAWFLLKKFSPVLPDAYFAQYYFNAPAYDIGNKGKERWRACLLETDKTMPFSVGMMFAKDVITPLTVNKVAEMLKEIKSAFKNGTKQLLWLDEATRDAVDVKIDDVLQTIAGPDLFKAGWLSNLYKDVTVVGKTYAQMFESAQKNMVQINLKRYFQPVKRDEFHFDGSAYELYDVNAFYDRTKNLIRILAGILRAPFLYTNGPSYINFAKLGAVLGHELLHGFDSYGWNYDKFGQISLWTTKHSQYGFKVRADCIKNQYSAYKSGSSYINGKKTLAENIADNAGLKYAYSAYKSLAARRYPNEVKPPGLKHLSYDQLFFIGYAQMWCRAASYRVKDYIALRNSHSPSKYRVIGSVSNFKPFADAFGCSRGTPMNPIKKCEFW